MQKHPALYIPVVLIPIVVAALIYVILSKPPEQDKPQPFNANQKPPEPKPQLSVEELLKPIVKDPKLPHFTLEQLKQYRTGKTVYVGCKGVIYDVSKNEVYREGGGYHAFAGRDASVALAKMNFGEELMDHSKNHWRKDLDQTGLNVLEEWVRFFTERYPIVGYLEDQSNDSKRQ